MGTFRGAWRPQASNLRTFCTQREWCGLAKMLLEGTLNRTQLPSAGVTVVFDLDGTVAGIAPDLIEAANAVPVAEGIGRTPADAIKSGGGDGT